MTTILIAVDRSSHASVVFKAGVELARALKARVVLYQTFEESPDFTPPGAGWVDLTAYLEKEARKQLASLAASAPDVPCELRIEEAAQPWRAILAAAKASGAGLIVLGSHGRHGWDRVLGTTATKVVNHAHCNVLVVHHKKSGRSARGA